MFAASAMEFARFLKLTLRGSQRSYAADAAFNLTRSLSYIKRATLCFYHQILSYRVILFNDFLCLEEH